VANAGEMVTEIRAAEYGRRNSHQCKTLHQGRRARMKHHMKATVSIGLHPQKKQEFSK